MFKILKDFIPYEEWHGFHLSDTIMFKILQKTSSSNITCNDYTEAWLQIIEEENKEFIKISINVTNLSNITKDDLINMLLDTINIKFNNKKEEGLEGLKGVFYFPVTSITKKFNNYVFSDLVMNNKMFSFFMAINESDKATKKKESLYIHFYDKKIGEVKANITPKISIRNDPDLRGKDMIDDFKEGEQYLRVKISSAKNTEVVEEFQEIFSKFLQIYDDEYDDICEFYEDFIKIFVKNLNLNSKTKTKIKLKIKLKQKQILG